MLPEPEPWLRGPIPGVDPLLAPILYSFQQAREDLAHWTAGLTTAQLWARPHGFGPVGYHLRHIAGSVERLMTYVQGRELSPEQFAAIARQMDPGATLDELMAELTRSLDAAESVVRALDPATLTAPRTVG